MRFVVFGGNRIIGVFSTRKICFDSSLNLCPEALSTNWTLSVPSDNDLMSPRP